MKFTIEANSDKATITLEYCGKTFAHNWVKKKPGHYVAEGKDIIKQAEETDAYSGYDEILDDLNDLVEDQEMLVVRFMEFVENYGED